MVVMVHRERKFASGLTLVEMVVCMAIVLIVVSGVGAAVADGFRGWRGMYDRLYSKQAADSVTAPRILDLVVRQAAGSRVLIDPDGSFVEVGQYENQDSVSVNRYARLYFEGDRLNLEEGELSPRHVLGSRTLCENVSSCVFRQLNRSVQMALTLDDGTYRKTVVSSAFIHGN